MGLENLGRRVAFGIARRVIRRARKYVAPVLPFVITPVAIGAGLSAGAMAFFFNIADDVRSQDGVWKFDHAGLGLALELRNPQRTALMKFVSATARPDIMSGIGLIGLLVAWRSTRYRPQGVLMAFALAGGGAIIGGIKARYARERPTLIEALVKEGTFSFPSGHSFISLVFYGIIAYFRMRLHPRLRDRAFIAVAAAKFILLIGASRVYLGVHYPSDVLAGYAAGFPWLTACLTAYSQYERRIQALPPPEDDDADEDDL
jgi:undecaprenyl-diphosphatase